jgi:hypothetical protein
MSRTNGQGGIPWGWLGAGAAVALVVVAGAGLALHMTGAVRLLPTGSASRESSDKASPEVKVSPEVKTAAQGPAAGQRPAADAPKPVSAPAAGAGSFSGTWYLNIRCRSKAYPFPTVDVGRMQIDQTSPTKAIVSYQDTGLPIPAKAEARIAGGQLSLEWKADGQAGETSYVSFTGRLSEPDTITADMKLVRRQAESDCTLTAETEAKVKEKMKKMQEEKALRAPPSPR